MLIVCFAFCYRFSIFLYNTKVHADLNLCLTLLCFSLVGHLVYACILIICVSLALQETKMAAR